jgi:hypothetical protein
VNPNDASSGGWYKSKSVDSKQQYALSGEEERAGASVRYNSKSASQSTQATSIITGSDTTTSCNNSNTSKKCLTDYYKNNKQPPNLPIETLMQKAQSILQRKFGHSTLRPLQATAIQRALQRINQIVIMATGGGKSVCYQLPALVGSGVDYSGSDVPTMSRQCMTTIVVCPLIALMMDQVRNLHNRGIYTAVCLSGSSTGREKAQIYDRLLSGIDAKKNKKDTAATSSKSMEHRGNNALPIQLLYVTPELIKTEKFRDVLSKLYDCKRLFQFAIDEAHCVSTWGHDFRGAYRELSWLRESFPDVPVMACEYFVFPSHIVCMYQL